MEVGDAAIAEVLEVHLKSGRVVRVALWGPGPRTLLPDADMIGLDSDDMIAVPYAAAAKLVDRQVQRLDGGILMPAISSSEWPAVLDRAKTHAVDPLEPVRER